MKHRILIPENSSAKITTEENGTVLIVEVEEQEQEQRKKIDANFVKLYDVIALHDNKHALAYIKKESDYIFNIAYKIENHEKVNAFKGEETEFWKLEIGEFFLDHGVCLKIDKNKFVIIDENGDLKYYKCTFMGEGIVNRIIFEK